MQDSHPSLNCTKTWYIHSGGRQKMLTALLNLAKFFECQGKMFLSVAKV